MDGAAFLYSDELARFQYGDDHPFKPMRARNTLELCTRYGLMHGRGIAQIDPPPVGSDVFAEFHTPDYLDALRRASNGEPDLSVLGFGLGTEDCPIVPGLVGFNERAIGATLHGVELVLAGKVGRAFNLVGGFHHAFRDHAEGFCYINDVGIAVQRVVAAGLRVAFIDIDAHHCNGVQDAFYDDDRVLVVSLHESGASLYPFGGTENEIGRGRGRGFNVNVPVLEQTDDEVYVDVFRQIVPPLLTAYAPDLVIAEIGADTMISDPLTHLRLTNRGYHQVLRDLCALAPRLVCVGGGGYDVYRTARCWTLAWSAMCGIEPEDSYAGLVGGMLYGGGAEDLYDPPIVTRGEAKERARKHAERIVAAVQNAVFPLIGARRP